MSCIILNKNEILRNSTAKAATISNIISLITEWFNLETFETECK